MAEASDSSDESRRPGPAEATSPAEFVEAMGRLKRWTGLGYRLLEKRAAEGGHALPRSTLTAALARDTLPRDDLVAAFTYACGCDEDETAQWIAARQRIAAGTAEAPTMPVVRPVRRRTRLLVRAAIVLAAVAAVSGGTVHLIAPSDSPRNPGQAAPAGPGPKPEPEPEPSQAPPATPTSPTVAPPPEVPVSGPVESGPPPPGTPKVPTPTGKAPAPTVPSLPGRVPDPPVLPPPPITQEPRVPTETGKTTVQLPGQPPIHCPTPYLGTRYGPLAQCTQQSGDQARSGFYSPFTGEFGPTTGWADVVDKKWYDGSVLATDGVRAWARGYGVVNTTYGGGVWATQYRDGEARWGVVNVVTNRFYPAETGWQRAGN